MSVQRRALRGNVCLPQDRLNTPIGTYAHAHMQSTYIHANKCQQVKDDRMLLMVVVVVVAFSSLARILKEGLMTDPHLCFQHF